MVDIIQGAWSYYLQNQAYFWQAVEQHLVLSFSSLGISLLVGLPLGVWISQRVTAAQVVLNIINTLRVLPSLAVLFLALPYLGLGFRPALVALALLALPPVLVNTYAGLRGVDPAVVEAAYGTGMAALQIFVRVRLPLAAPVILVGIRVAAVEVISSATLAAFIGGGGLGDFITRGFALYDTRIMLVGAIPVAILALVSDGLFSGWQRRLQQAAAGL